MAVSVSVSVRNLMSTLMPLLTLPTMPMPTLTLTPKLMFVLTQTLTLSADDARSETRGAPARPGQLV